MAKMRPSLLVRPSQTPGHAVLRHSSINSLTSQAGISHPRMGQARDAVPRQGWQAGQPAQAARGNGELRCWVGRLSASSKGDAGSAVSRPVLGCARAAAQTPTPLHSSSPPALSYSSPTTNIVKKNSSQNPHHKRHRCQGTTASLASPGEATASCL